MKGANAKGSRKGLNSDRLPGVELEANREEIRRRRKKRKKPVNISEQNQYIQEGSYVIGSVGTMRKPLSLNLPLRGVSR